MCTSLAMNGLFGRNLDLESRFGEQVAVAPRALALPLHACAPLTRHYAMIGMASAADGLPLFAEAMNEKGLYMAGLNFPGNAYYFPENAPDKQNVAPYELIWLVLGTCATLAEARRLLENVQVAARPFAEGWPLAPLHWHVADASGALVAEPTAEGLRLYDDPVGVLTNNPPYPYQLQNLANYRSLTPRVPENRFSKALDLAVYGQGMGAIGLPGDASPASRFVRAAFLKENSAAPEGEMGGVAQFFRILDAVAMVRGSVVTEAGECDVTTYSCCIDAESGVYYYKTYANSALAAVRLFAEDLEADRARFWPLRETVAVQYEN